MPKSPKLPRGPRKGKKRAGGGKAGKKFEGTPITAETKYETQSSPKRAIRAAREMQKRINVTSAAANKQAQGRKPPKVDLPDEDKYWMFPR
jgi:hypothetical protein